MTERRAGHVLLLVALLAVVALYAPTLSRGLVNYDDPWLVTANWIVRTPSVSSVQAVLFDLGRDTRAVLGAEYLPVRDLSIMLDVVVWGDSYGGFHATNLAVYLAAIALWFAALLRFGIDARVAGIAILLWALHPTHAESVAWITERKGLLSVAFAGGAALGFARHRSGGGTRWLALAALAAVAAVWSKATGAFTIAALAGLEVALPARRVSWRRSLVGLGVLAAVTLAAFVPVLIVASRMQVVGTSAPGGGWIAMVLGVHGVDVQLAAMTGPSSVSYPITSIGPRTLDIVLGAAGLVALAVAAARGRGAVRAGALVWLVAWFPTSRILLPVQQVIVADRYLLVPTLGLALVVAAGVCAIPRRVLAHVAVSALALASAARTLAAQAAWRDDVALWSRATTVNPHDGNAWSQYAESLAASGDVEGAARVTDEGLTHTQAPKLMLRRALLLAGRGDRDGALVWMTRAADAGEPLALTNLAVLLLDRGDIPGALDRARRAVAIMPLYAHGHRIRGKVALAAQRLDEARDAFARAVELEPANYEHRYNLGLALEALGDRAGARAQFEQCLASPPLVERARAGIARVSP